MTQPKSPVLVLLIGGLVLVALAGLVASGGFSWFGKLPGDIRIEGGRTRVVIPLTSMLLVSLAITLVVNLLRRLT